jgi:hypothetical protein
LRGYSLGAGQDSGRSWRIRGKPPPGIAQLWHYFPGNRLRGRFIALPACVSTAWQVLARRLARTG